MRISHNNSSDILISAKGADAHANAGDEVSGCEQQFLDGEPTYDVEEEPERVDIYESCPEDGMTGQEILDSRRQEIEKNADHAAYLDKIRDDEIAEAIALNAWPEKHDAHYWARFYDKCRSSYERNACKQASGFAIPREDNCALVANCDADMGDKMPF